ncbi:MAG: hypothetical protein Q8P05_00670 [Candidatus Diapherotrites archaeon]|nr:hypothetical protein [Candidatus Diapherotrites archaeon]
MKTFIALGFVTLVIGIVLAGAVSAQATNQFHVSGFVTPGGTVQGPAAPEPCPDNANGVPMGPCVPRGAYVGTVISPLRF